MLCTSPKKKSKDKLQTPNRPNLTQLSSYNSRTKLNMDMFECCTFKESIVHKIGFTGIQTQGYSKLTKNIQRQGNLIPKFKIESNMVPSQTAQIAYTHQGEKLH